MLFRVSGGWGGIRTHGRLHVAGFQDRCLKPLGHPSSIGGWLSRVGTGCARRGMNQAGRMGVNQTSLRCWEEGVLSAISSWVWVAASAVSVGSSAAPVSAPSVEPATVAAASAAAFQSSAYSWAMYKTRLA